MRNRKRIYLLVGGAILLIATGIIFFKWWGRSVAAWRFVPSGALAVLASEHLQDSSFHATDAKIDLRTLPIAEHAVKALDVMNWFSHDPRLVKSFLVKKNITYSFHKRSGEELGIIMYIPVSGTEESEWLINPRRSDVRVLHHAFQGQEINDINNTSSQALFSYFVKDNFLIISKHGDLVEEVVRELKLGLKKLILHSKFGSTVDEQYLLNLYIDKNTLNTLVFRSDGTSVNRNEFVGLFPDYQDYHLRDSENSAVTLESEGCDPGENYISDWLEGSSALPFKSQSYISQQTSYLFRTCGKNVGTFREKFLKWHEEYKHDAWNKVNYYLQQESANLLRNFGSEIIFCQFESNSSVTNGKLILAQYDNYAKVRPLLERLARLSTPESNMATDQFQGYDVFSVAIPDLPAGIFGSVYKGFSKSYICYVAPYLVFCNDIQVLRNYLNDFENQLTWKQAPEQDSLLTHTDAQLSLVINVRKSRTASEAGAFNQDFISKVENVVFECKLEDKKAFPRMILLPKKRKTSPKVLNRTFLSSNVEWPVLYDSVMATLQNPMDGSSELLLTDVNHSLLKIEDGKNRRARTVTKLDGGITTMPYNIDFLNIGRPQRILATRSAVYAIDEDEAGIVTSFRGKIPGSEPVRAMYRVDGGNEGGNRFVIRTGGEELYVWNNAYQNPRKINRFTRLEGVLDPIVALNQLGKKLFVITQQNGKLIVLKEDGTYLQGFPIDFLTRLDGAFTWTQNMSTSQTELTGISARGELISVDLSGKITRRQQLMRPESSSRFRTLFDCNSLDWLLIRQEDSRIAILNKDGKELFEIVNVKSGSEIKYHFFGTDNRFISVTSGGYTTIFDLTGRLIGDKPIPSDKPVRLAYQASFYKLLVVGYSDDKVQTWSIKIR